MATWNGITPHCVMSSSSSSYSLSLTPLMYLTFSHRCRFRHAVVTSAARRHHRRRLLKYSPNPSSAPAHHQPAIFKLSDDTLQITLISPTSSLQKLETKLNQLLVAGREAFDDLRTVVAVDGSTGGVVISCRRSTVEFFSVLFVSSLVLVIAVRSLFSMRKNCGGEALVYKRDRSLGGKVVAVGKRESDWSTSRASTPLSSESSEYYYQKKRDKMKSSRRRKEELPQWWPQVVSQGPVEVENKEEYQRLANQLIQGWCQFMF